MKVINCVVDEDKFDKVGVKRKAIDCSSHIIKEIAKCLFLDIINSFFQSNLKNNICGTFPISE